MKKLLPIILIILMQMNTAFTQVPKTITFTSIDVPSGSCFINQESFNEEFGLSLWCSVSGSNLYMGEWSIDIDPAGNYTLSSSSDCDPTNTWTFNTNGSSGVTVYIEVFESDDFNCSDHADSFDDCKGTGTVLIDLTQSSGSFGSSEVTVNYTITAAASGSNLSCPSILPVELSQFDGESTIEEILLSWKTDTEIETEMFLIEKSTDGKKWLEVGVENALGYGGTYSFVDEKPLSGINYYRLKMVDYGGIFDYSKVVAVKHDVARESFSLYPNPAGDFITIQKSENNNTWKEIRLFSATGRLIKMLPLDENKWDVSNLNAGSYYIQVITANGLIAQPFIKK